MILKPANGVEEIKAKSNKKKLKGTTLIPVYHVGFGLSHT
jgi:hypothetical protein